MNQTKTASPKVEIKCKNIFLEEDGYCTRCGKNHYSVAFGKVFFYEPKAVNKEETSSYADTEGSVDADEAQADFRSNGKHIRTVIVTSTADGIENIKTDGLTTYTK